MTLVMLRLAVLLNSMDSGHINPGEAEHALSLHLHQVVDPGELLGLGPTPTLRIALAQMPRLGAGAGESGWALALVTPGRLGGLRGPAELNRAALAGDPEPELDAVPVVVRHDGRLAWLAAEGIPAAESLDVEVVNLVLARGERPLSPTTPTEAARTLAAGMSNATESVHRMSLAAGHRPRPAGTVTLGAAYPPTNQSLLDLAMSVLAIVAAARSQESQLPHSHAVTTRATSLAPLRTAALDAVQAAVSWPTHLMV